MRLVASVSCFVVLAASPSFAQSQAGFGYGPFWERPLYIGASVGVMVPTSEYAQISNTGGIGAINVAWPFTRHHGAWLQAEIAYATASLNAATLTNYGATAGTTNVTSGTLNVVLNKRDFFGNFTPYIIFGGGAYWRVVSLQDYTGNSYCNDFVGFCGVYGTTPATRSRTQLVPGANGGGGIRYRLRPFRLFLEARYNTLDTSHGNTDFVPVVIGMEW